MPQVPQYNEQVRVSAPNLTAPSADAFGGAVYQQGAQLGQTISNAGTALNDYIKDQQKAEAQKNVIKQDTDFRKQLQDTLYSTTPNDDGKPTGFLNRNLSQAAGITVEFDKTFNQMKNDYLNQSTSDYQKQLLNKLIDDQYISNRNQVISHEATQMRTDTETTLKSNLDQRVMNASSISDPTQLIDLVAQSKALNTSQLKNLGYNQDYIDTNNQKLVGDLVKSSISSLLENNFTEAKNLFDYMKHNLSGTDINEINKVMVGRELAQEQADYWDKVKGLKLSDGMPDRQAMIDYLQKQSMQPDKYEKIWVYVKDRADELHVNITQQRESAKEAYRSAVVTAKNQGKSLDSVQKMASQFTKDPYTQYTLKKEAKDIYAPPEVKTDPILFVNLYNRASNRDVDQKELDKLYLGNTISRSDYESLSTKLSGAITKHIDQNVEFAIQQVQRNTATQFSKSQNEEKSQYLYQFFSQIQGVKDPQKIYEIANKLKADGQVTGRIWGTNSKPLYQIKSDAEKNATEALNKAGVSVSPEAIKYVLSIYPKGKVPDGALRSRNGK